MSETVKLPDPVVANARAVQAERDFQTLGDAVRFIVRGSPRYEFPAPEVETAADCETVPPPAEETATVDQGSEDTDAETATDGGVAVATPNDSAGLSAAEVRQPDLPDDLAVFATDTMQRRHLTPDCQYFSKADPDAADQVGTVEDVDDDDVCSRCREKWEADDLPDDPAGLLVVDDEELPTVPSELDPSDVGLSPYNPVDAQRRAPVGEVPDHLSPSVPEDAQAACAELDPDDPTRYYCCCCGNTVTLSPTSNEYGHARDCEHSCRRDDGEGVA